MAALTTHDRTDLRWSEDVLRAPHDAADKAQRVRATFERIAGRYDRVNRILSFGRDRAWRRAAVEAVGPCDGASVLDLACGTGALARLFSEAGATRVVGADFSASMLAVARKACVGRAIEWVQADAMDLPMAEGRFDIVSVGFGLRNFADAGAALAEIRRVLRPGGRIVVLEFAPGQGRFVGPAVRWFVRHMVPWIGRVLSRDRGGAYKYLASSVETYLTFQQQRQAMAQAGFADVQTTRRMALGTVGVHTGITP